jgi:eukaryotic-like serine/threonine-protein kinase
LGTAERPRFLRVAIYRRVRNRGSSTMVAVNACPDCGAEPTANAPAGLCPQCLLRLGLGASLSVGPEVYDGPDLSPSRMPDGDHGRFRGLCGAIGLSQASGILTTLPEAFGPVPRVLLRDSPSDDQRPVRPGSEEMPDLAGDAGRYQLLGEIARGGIGVVLLGRDVDLGRDLAVKVLLEKHCDQPEMVRRFVEEAQIGGQLQHPGVVPVHEIGRFPDGRLYIAMKLVRGRTLAALLEGRKGEEDDRNRFLSVFEQVCQAMAYAHSRGVIHRDLKPSNVMAGSFGEVQVMDWGLAKVLDRGGVDDDDRAGRRPDDAVAVRTVRTGSESAESRAGSVLGTPAYMSPEQARGALDTLDERADVFGLGSILCEILTGEPAYTGSTSVELYRKAERPELADALARLDACGADGELVALAKACLAAAPKDRPRDAGVVLTSLTAYLAGVKLRLRTAELAQAKAESLAAEERKRRLLWVALAALVLAIALLGGGGWSWVARESKVRVEATALAVNQALDDAAGRRDEARAAPDGASAKWVEALEAAKRAEALLARGEGSSELRGRVSVALSSIAAERAAAESTEKDRRMVERLAEIHASTGVILDLGKVESDYAAAFRDYGVDVDSLDSAEAGARLASRPVAAELANALDQWTFIRRGPNADGVGARRLVAVAKAADPDPWRNWLRDTLDRAATDRRGALDALEQLAATADPEKLPEASVTRLAHALGSMGSKQIAVSLLRRVQQVHPENFWINCDLGRELLSVGQPGEASRFYSAAVAVSPRSGLALGHLGKALHTAGRLDEAAACFRRAVQLRPDDAIVRVNLGAVMLDLLDTNDAAVEFGEAKRLRPDDWRVRHEIADALLNRGEWTAAVTELREAVDREPRHAMARNALAGALLETGRIDEAVVSFREAIRLDPRHAPSYAGLGRALLAKGELEGALDAFRKDRGGRRGTNGRSPSGGLLRETEQWVALNRRLPAVLRGEDRPADSAELIGFARLCAASQHYAASARLWSEAFTRRPSLTDDLKVGHRYAAACSAALAGCGAGKDDPPLDDPGRLRLRRQALDWLKAELSSAAELLRNASSGDRAGLPRRLGRWWVDPALAGLREDSPLSTLPKLEQDEFRALWADAEALRAEVKKSVRPTATGRPF